LDTDYVMMLFGRVHLTQILQNIQAERLGSL
jgi:hypothetical protein